MTDYQGICNILGQLFAEHKEDTTFKRFVEFNDLGLPLAYLVSENLCDASPDGEKYIAETWEMFLNFLKISDTGFSNLDEMIAAALEE